MDRRSEPRTTARACQFCRRRKIKCDALKPSCTTCRTSNRTCNYHRAPAQPRPSTALINSIREEKNELERMLVRVKLAAPGDRDAIIDSIELVDGRVRLPTNPVSPVAVADDDAPGNGYPTPSGSRTREAGDDCEDSGLDDDCDVPNFLSIDETSQAGIFGPGSDLGAGTPAGPASPMSSATMQQFKYQLIANAATSRQQEYRLRSLSTIRGVRAELALHLLDLHWNRQHHTYLLTYRPVFMRELVDGGPYCTDFLLNAIFACASKFSERIELRDDPTDPESVGRGFFRRCEEIISRESVLSQSRIPTIIGLLMLGATYNARGRTSKGWLYTGYALRMVFDLGLHLDSQDVRANPEDAEIRRRVFWGAFICEKLQSVYLGRPVTIQLRDAQVSRDFMDTFEELEPWAPYLDPQSRADASAAARPWSALTYSVSVFQQLCLLAKIMTSIINEIYFVGATARKTRTSLSQIDDALTVWYRSLPSHLVYEPWNRDPLDPATATATAPNLTILHTTYHCLVILLHRPFISALKISNASAAARSWKRCTTAARNITSLVLSYRSAYPLRKSNYMLSYAVYVACTIHVHNAAALSDGGGSAGNNNNGNNRSSSGGGNSTSTSTRESDCALLRASLGCLDELAIPNSGAADTARIVRKLMAAKGIPEHAIPSMEGIQQVVSTAAATTTALHGDNLLWPPLGGSPGFEEEEEQMPQLQSFSDFGLFAGHDLLFGFMENNFSPSYVLDGQQL